MVIWDILKIESCSAKYIHSPHFKAMKPFLNLLHTHDNFILYTAIIFVLITRCSVFQRKVNKQQPSSSALIPHLICSQNKQQQLPKLLRCNFLRCNVCSFALYNIIKIIYRMLYLLMLRISALGFIFG